MVRCLTAWAWPNEIRAKETIDYFCCAPFSKIPSMNYQNIIYALDVIEPDTVINNMEFMEKELALIHDLLIRLGHPSESKDIEIAAFHYLDLCKEDEGYDGWLPLKEVEAWRHKLCKRLYATTSGTYTITQIGDESSPSIMTSSGPMPPPKPKPAFEGC